MENATREAGPQLFAPVNTQQIKLPDGFNPHVAFFPHCKAVKGGRNSPISGLFAAVKNGKWEKTITTLRTLEYGSPDYDKAKRKLPCVMLSASTANGGHKATNIEQHSGLLQIDVDNLSLADAVALRERLASDPHMLATWLSPSARGVKGALRIPESVEDHKRAFECASSYFREKHGVVIDPRCKDPCRLCFVSYDPDIRLNAGVVPLPITSLGTDELPTTRSNRKKPPTSPSNKDSTTSLHSSSSILHPAFCILHNKERLFDDFPKLERFYLEHVTKRIGKPQKGTRNEALIEMVSWLVFVLHPRFVTAFANAYFCEHPAIFDGYTEAEYERQTKSHLEACLASYPSELNGPEADSYAEMLNEEERATFRICRSLANSVSEPDFPPPLFFLSAEKLAARLGKLDMQAWRILGRFEKLRIIECVKRGTRRTSGKDNEATVYRWLLSIP